ncbi:IS1/IS6 family transposase [Nitrosopumilus sp. K4]|uniref:DDE-type integrase/transposase/recombinase n=1 Tax=Nitrosopumilus sp. K4 TaxID=2795383 RepID=UPI001BA9CBAA|nr:DDE-type integrase/transposase/recombinase [Nitrosopumilus sp. K4]QUC64164.1 IS1/IS6 family transposase [Nitrosopumilus sp. K4]
MTELRKEKAIQIFSTQSVRKITKNNYVVMSQSSNREYIVRKLSNADIWTCECPDFTYRLTRKDDKHCKHIISVQILQNSINDENKIERIERPKICPKCYSTSIVKNGLRKVNNGIKRQRYACKQCSYKFVLGENGFSKVSSDPKIITESINLYMSGMSFRNISRHIQMTHDQVISHTAIYNWFKKYMGIIREHVDSIMPQTSDVWSLDEMMLNVKNTEKHGKGFYDWLWTIIDPHTRFVLATEVSKKREIIDAKNIIRKGKKTTSVKPNYVITDSLHSYEKAIRHELDARVTAHIKTKSLSDGFQNRPIERYHNEIREKLKARRGLGNDKSAEEFCEAYRVYHNFVRPHTGLPDNITPAQASGIDLDLGEDKIRELISQSTEQKNFATQLGKRIKKVSISNEGDCIKVIPNGWIDKSVWREINDILKLSEFSWLSNGKDSCWMKLLE